jgi:hypothetical protein
MDGHLSNCSYIGKAGMVGYWLTSFSQFVRHDNWTVWHWQNPGYRCHVGHHSNNPGVLHITNFHEDRVVSRLLVRVKKETSIRGAGK